MPRLDHHAFNVRVIKKLNYVPVVEDGAKREAVVL